MFITLVARKGDYEPFLRITAYQTLAEAKRYAEDSVVWMDGGVAYIDISEVEGTRVSLRARCTQEKFSWKEF